MTESRRVCPSRPAYPPSPGNDKQQRHKLRYVWVDIDFAIQNVQLGGGGARLNIVLLIFQPIYFVVYLL